MVELGSSAVVAQSESSATVALQRFAIFQNVWPADFNGDGFTDLAGSEELQSRGGTGRVIVLVGNGAGNFTATNVTSYVGHVLAVGDFDRDGRTDLVVADAGDANPAILPGNGNGTFGAPRVVNATEQVTFALSGDLDGDGKRDLVVGAEGTTVAVYPGNGDFSFGPAVTLAVNASPHDGIITDLNGDGRRDLVVANHYIHSVTVLINQGAMQFAGADVPLSGNGNDVTVADVNRDGKLDLVVATSNGGDGDFWFEEGHAEVLLGGGDGSFAAGASYAVPRGAWQVVVGDFTRDGITDIATANRSSIGHDDWCGTFWKTWDSVTILPGRADGTFGAASSFSLGNQSEPDDDTFKNHVRTLNTTDLNRDGATDLVVSWGVVLSNVQADVNWAPVVDARPDQRFDNAHETVLTARAVDDDQDMLTWTWRDAAGNVLANWPSLCYRGLHEGANVFTVTVDDGHGHQTSDTVTVTVGAGTSGGDPWQQTDVGAVAKAGSTTFSNGVYTVSASGADIWGTTDEFRFTYQTSSDSSIVVTARVDSVQNVHAWTKAGVMIRAGSGAAAPHASVFVTPGKGISFQRRLTAGGTSVLTAGPLLTAPVWLKLVSQVTYPTETIRAYYRKNATDPWTLVGQDTFSTVIAQPQAGLAVTSHADGTLATAVFSAVSINPVANWSAASIGTAAGSATWDANQVTLKNAGTDIWGTADEFEYAYQDCFVDCTITARVTSLRNTHHWAKAGVMIRESSAADSRHVDVIVSVARGVAMQYRSATGGISTTAGSAAGAAPGWVRLTRTGNVFTGYWSTDGVAFTPIGSITVPMDESAMVGIATTSHNRAATTTAVFDDVAIVQP
jgi:regulation of enolase protein 1 (concanavalin A-like superfamily)